MRYLMLVFLLIFSSTLYAQEDVVYEDPDPNDQPVEVGGQVWVNTPELNLHAEADPESEIVATLEEGELVTVTDGAENAWWKVQTEEGTEGWTVEGVMIDGYVPHQYLLPLCLFTENRIAYVHVDYIYETPEDEANGMIPYSVHNVYTSDPDGQNVCRLTGFANYDRWIKEVSWSPGGSTIAFAYGESIYIMSADGSDFYSLDKYGESFTWSPDSMQLAFAYRNEDDFLTSTIELYDFETGEFNKIVSSDHLINYVRWSPVEPVLVYVENNIQDMVGSVFTVSADPEVDDEPQRIADGSESMFMYFTAEWSPDGTQVATAKGSLYSGLVVEVINPDQSIDVIAEGDFERGTEAPVWMPDGETLLYWDALTFEMDGNKLIKVSEGSSTTLTSGVLQPNRYWPDLSFRPEGYVMPVSVSPDGTAAVYWSLDGVTVIDTETGETTVIDTSSPYVPPMWQPE